jgi:4-amino-4-deoxy-L-arabinose transferase-like glycosyltransferase
VAVLEAAAVTIAALAIRLVRLDSPVFIDELYHVLAAQSWLQNGTLAIGDGVPYTRAKPYTMLVATLFQWLGAGVVQARIPSVIAGALLVGVMFLWVRRVAGRLPAWLTAAFIALDPDSIGVSQIGRFYTLHVLFIWLGAIALYSLRRQLHEEGVLGMRRGVRATALAGSAALAFAGALGLHDLSVIGVGLVLVWFAMDSAGDTLQWLRGGRWRVWIATVVALGFLVVAYFVVDAPRLFEYYVYLFGRAPLWSPESWLYYHWEFQTQYGPLWTLVPVLAAAAFLWKPRPTAFLAWFFFAGIVVQSFAAWKAWRYVAYLTPAYFALCGIGLARFADLAHGALVTAARRAFGLRNPRIIASVAFAIVAGAAGLLALDANRAAPYTFRILTADAVDRPLPYMRGDWQAAMPVLAPLAQAADAVVTSADVKALYYLGRLDYAVCASDLAGAPEFTRRPRTGKPVVQSPRALERIRSCHASGLIVIDWGHDRQRAYVPRDAMDWIEENTEPVPLDERVHLLAFRWDDDARSDPAPADCPPEGE